MKILVTGSKGTIGIPLVKELSKRGYEVWQCDLSHHRDANYIRADIAKYRQLERIFEAADYDVVYHLAAEFGRMNGEEYYENLWETNVIGTRNILEWQKKKGFKLIFTSSSEIYGDDHEVALSENLPLEVPTMQLNDYAITKWVNEIQIMNFEKRYGNECVRLRLFNAYGPGEYYHNYRSVICLFCYRALFDIPYQVYLGYHRTFMYIDDVIPTMAAVCNKFIPGEIYNIGGHMFRSIEEASNIVLGCLGKNDDLVKYLPEDKHNVVDKRADIEKARKALGHDPKTPLEIGIPKTLEWMKGVY